MFGLKETGLRESWLTGAVMSAALVRPVIDARMSSGGDEAYVRALRQLLQFVFEKWRDENGTFPVADGGLLGSFNLYEGKSLGECPPYACMGKSRADYADLLAKLTAAQYPPLIELETAANEQGKPTPSLPDDIPRLPATVCKTGMQCIIAALILSEAAAGMVESATKAHWELSRIQAEIQRQQGKAIHASNERLYRFATTGAKSHQGHKKRAKDKDILVFQKEAASLFAANNYNIAKTLEEPALEEYCRKHYGAHTLRDALKKIKPKGTGPKGRPKKR